jgi:hypothetical protein
VTDLTPSDPPTPRPTTTTAVPTEEPTSEPTSEPTTEPTTEPTPTETESNPVAPPSKTSPPTPSAEPTSSAEPTATANPEPSTEAAPVTRGPVLPGLDALTAKGAPLSLAGAVVWAPVLFLSLLIAASRIRLGRRRRRFLKAAASA